MTLLDRLQRRTREKDEVLLLGLLEDAKMIFFSLRYPYAKKLPEDVEPRYKDWQLRCALDMYNRLGAEGQLTHNENGINRSYGAEWVSNQLLREITPYCGVVK